jgi:hypothetical protein
MHRRHCTKARARSLLAVLVVGALGLAASPAALAKDRGGPGQPGAQQQRVSDKKPVLPRKLRPGRSVSWSD